jgi:hypothetical protein
VSLPLPVPTVLAINEWGGVEAEGYTADQMLAYGRAVEAATLERADAERDTLVALLREARIEIRSLSEWRHEWCDLCETKGGHAPDCILGRIDAALDALNGTPESVICRISGADADRIRDLEDRIRASLKGKP